MALTKVTLDVEQILLTRHVLISLYLQYFFQYYYEMGPKLYRPSFGYFLTDVRIPFQVNYFNVVYIL